LVVGLATVRPWLASAAESLAESLGHVPWRYLGAIIGGLAAFALIDTLRPRQAATGER
jgi:hypothetical protein